MLIINNNETQIPLIGETWEEVRLELEENCSISIVDTWTLFEYNGTKEATATVTITLNDVIEKDKH